MNPSSNLFLLTIGLPLLANLGSVFWQILHNRPFRVIYLPVAARTESILRLLAITIVGFLAIDHFVLHYLQPTSGTFFIVLGFALLNGLSVYYRWRVPLSVERTSA